MTVMTKRTRTILFFVLGSIFVSVAPAILLYSQGYRFSWNEMQFSKVGAFYLSIVPTRAEVLINGKTIGKTARVLGTTLTKNFSPGTYSVRVQKEGYHSWEKRLEIFPKQVTELKHITLLPANPAFVVLQDTIRAVWFGPNKTEALLQKSNPKNTWTLFLWDVQENTEYPLYESSLAQDEIWNIEWDLDPNSFLLQIVSQEQQKSFVQTIDRNLLQSQKTAAESLQASSRLRAPVASRLDYVQAHTGITFPRNVSTFFADNQQVLWLDQAGMLWRRTRSDAQPRQLNEQPLLIEAETPYEIFTSQNEFFVQNKDVLYILDQETRTLEEFFTPFYEMVQSPDAKKLALSTGKEIWLYFFEEQQEQPRHQKGEKLFLTRLSEDIKNLGWFNSHYLMFAQGGAIMVSEIDNRDHLNMVELAKFSLPSVASAKEGSPTFFWQDDSKMLLVHTGNQIRASEKLLP